MKLTRYFLPAILALAGILTFVAPVAASYQQPTILEIQEITAYENYYEEDAQLYIITYYIDFEDAPAQDADELFLFQLLDDGDAIATKSPFPFHDDGYGLGIVSFYLDSGDAPTWESSNVAIKLVGNPMVEWDGGLPSTSSDAISWNTDTLEETTKAVSSEVLALAADLEESWDVDMVTTSEGVTTLTDNGSTYFLNVIPYLQTGAPSVFGQYVFAPDFPIDEKPAPDSYANWLEESVEDTVFDLGPVARAHGWNANTMRTGIYYAFVVALFVLLITKNKLNKGTMLLFWPFVIAGAFFGVPLQVTIIAGFFCLISTVWMFYKGAT